MANATTLVMLVSGSTLIIYTSPEDSTLTNYKREVLLAGSVTRTKGGDKYGGNRAASC
jgi:hypothetical protein